MIIAKDGSSLVLWTCKAFKSFVCCFKLRLRLRRWQEKKFTTKPSKLAVNNAGLLGGGRVMALFWTFNSTQLWFFKMSSYKKKELKRCCCTKAQSHILEAPSWPLNHVDIKFTQKNPEMSPKFTRTFMWIVPWSTCVDINAIITVVFNNLESVIIVWGLYSVSLL